MCDGAGKVIQSVPCKTLTTSTLLKFAITALRRYTSTFLASLMLQLPDEAETGPTVSLFRVSCSNCDGRN